MGPKLFSVKYFDISASFCFIIIYLFIIIIIIRIYLVFLFACLVGCIFFFFMYYMFVFFSFTILKPNTLIFVKVFFLMALDAFNGITCIYTILFMASINMSVLKQSLYENLLSEIFSKTRHLKHFQ